MDKQKIYDEYKKAYAIKDTEKIKKIINMVLLDLCKQKNLTKK